MPSNMMDSDKILEARKLVLAFREESKDVYPWPDDDHCILFAITELGEAIDALLREEDGWLRNNEKEHSFYKELGDAAYMILSVRQLQIGEYFYIDRYFNDMYRQVIEALRYTSRAYYNNSELSRQMLLTNALEVIDSVSGFDIAGYVKNTLDKQRRKHLK